MSYFTELQKQSFISSGQATSWQPKPGNKALNVNRLTISNSLHFENISLKNVTTGKFAFDFKFKKILERIFS